MCLGRLIGINFLVSCVGILVFVLNAEGGAVDRDIEKGFEFFENLVRGSYCYIEPEVAGGLGRSSVLDVSEHPPVVYALEYEFEGWLGDGLLQSFPCFIVTEALAAAIRESDLTGCSFDIVSVVRSETFGMLYPHVALPNFVWLKVHGIAGVADFGLAEDKRLVVSIASKNVISKFGLRNASFEAFG